MKHTLKKMIVSSLAVATCLSATVPAFAQNMTEVEIKAMVAERSTDEKIYSASNIIFNDAIYEGNNVARVATVTESGAWVTTEETSVSGRYDECGEGYVTVKDGTRNVYHYTRAELHRSGSCYIKSDNLYGYGKVDASTNFVAKKSGVTSTAKVFYGGF